MLVHPWGVGVLLGVEMRCLVAKSSVSAANHTALLSFCTRDLDNSNAALRLV